MTVTNWLVTGGCGFIGVNLIDSLRKNGVAEGDVDPADVRIRVLDDLSTGTVERLGRVAPEIQQVNLADLRTDAPWSADHVQLVQGDIRDADAARAAAQGADAIVHLAAHASVPESLQDPVGDFDANVVGTVNLLEAARLNDVPKFVFASSSAAVGEIEPPVSEDQAPAPISPYGAAKLAGEGYCSAYHASYGIGAASLRFGNVYGPHSEHKTSVVAKWIKRALAGEPIEIYGSGTQTRDFIYVDDLTRAIGLAAVRDEAAGETFQIATSRETSILELAGILEEVLKKAGIEGVKVVHKDPRPGDIEENWSDTGKAERLMGWTAATGLHAGLNTAVDWLASSGPGSQ